MKNLIPKISIILFILFSLSVNNVVLAQTISTLPATNIGPTEATLNGTYSPGIYDSLYYKYGKFFPLVTKTPLDKSLLGNSLLVPNEKKITGLTTTTDPNNRVKYYFTFCGITTTKVETCGNSLSFTTTDASGNNGANFDPNVLFPSPKKDTNVIYTFLAPLSSTFKNFDSSALCSFGTYANIMFRIFISICAILAMIMIVSGGIQYMTSEFTSSKGEAKSTIQNAILGLFIVFGTYLLLNTINPKILNLCVDEGLIQADVLINPDEPQELVNGKYGDYTAGSETYANWATQAGTTVPTVLPLGVKAKIPECTWVGQTGCTSLLGLNPRIINAIWLGCPSCELVITGGTENWLHSRSGGHRPGSPVIDLRDTPSLNKHLTGNEASPGNGTKVYKDGATFQFEGIASNKNTTGTHWHVY